MPDANLGRAVLEITAKDINLTKNMQKSEADVKAWVARMEAQFNKIGQDMGKSFDTASSKTSTSLAKIESAGTKSATGLKNLETSVVSNAGSFSKLESALGSASGKLSKMTTDVAGGAKGMGLLNNAVSGLVPGLALGSVGIAGLGIAAIKSAGDFEASMARLQLMAGVTDQTSAAFGQLKNAALQVGQSTMFSSQEAADGMTELASAGLNAQQTIAAIGPVARVAEINQVSMAEAANTATTAMNAFGLSANDTAKIMDIQTTAANMGVLKFQGFQQAIANVGSVAKLSNQSLTDMTSVLVALTNNGQSAADAGTTIKSALLALTNPSTEAAAAMQQIGLNVYDSFGKMRPFAEIVAQVEKNTRNMTDAQRNQLLATIAGSDGVRAFAGALGATVTVQRDGKEVTLKGADALKEFQRQLDNSAGSADKAASVIHNTFNAKVEELKGSVEELFRQFGEELLPAAKQTVDVLGTKVDPFAWMKDWKGIIPIIADATVNLDHTNQTLEKTAQLTGPLRLLNPVLYDAAYATRIAAKSLQDKASAEQTATQAAEVHRKKLLELNQTIDEVSTTSAKATIDYVAQTRATLQSWEASEKHRKALLALNNTIDGNVTSFQHLSPPMQSVYDKANALDGKINSLVIAMGHLNDESDILSSKINANNQIISTMDMGVDQLALKHQGAKVAIDGVNMTLDDAYSKWKDYTTIQAAGGQGSYEAGVKAGQLATALVKVDGSFQPLLDTTYNAINANSKNKDSLVATTEASAKYQLAIDNMTPAQRAADDAFESAAEKARNHGLALQGTSSAANTTTTAIDKTTGAVGTYNQTDPKEKTANTNFVDVGKNIKEAKDRLDDWAKTQVDPKTVTVTGVDEAGSVFSKIKGMWDSLVLSPKTVTINSAPGAIGPQTVAPGSTYPGGTAPSRPAPTPARGAQSVGASTFGLGDQLGRSLSGVQALDAATKTAQATAFSLTGLQSQIEQIVKMFGNLDTKALKAASDQADQVQKITGAASGMVDLFGKLQDYVSVGKATMDRLSTDSAEMTASYIAGAKNFDVKALAGAATYIDTSGKVASAASSMADSLNKVRNWAVVGKDSIWKFTQDVFSLTADFYNVSQTFNKDMLDGAAWLADTAGKVGEAAGKMADGLNKVRNWSVVSQRDIYAFRIDMHNLIADFYNVSQQFTEDMLKGANSLTDTAGNVGEATSKMADGLAKVRDWGVVSQRDIYAFRVDMHNLIADFYNVSTQFNDDMLKGAVSLADTAGKVADATSTMADALKKIQGWGVVGQVAIQHFVDDLGTAVTEFKNHSDGWTVDMLTATSSYADTAGKVAGAIGSGFEGLTKLKDYSSPAAGKVQSFADDILTITTKFKDAAFTFKDSSGKYAPELLDAAKAFAEAGGAVVEAVGKGVDGFTKLSTYKGVAPDAITALEESMHFAVTELNRLTGDVDTTMMDKAKEFGDKVGSFFGAMGDALETFTKLADYKGVAPAAIDGLIESMRLAVAKVGSLKEAADTDLLTRVKAFGESTQQLFDGLKAGMEVFSGLEKYKAIPPAVINGFIQALVDTINSTGRLAAGVDQGLLTKAEDFAQNITDVFGKLKGGIDTFSSITNFKDDPGKAVDTIITGVNVAVGKMAGAQTAAQNLYNKAVAFHQKMQDAANEMAAGMQAGQGSGAGAGAGGGGSSTLAFSPFSGGAGTLSNGFSMGGSGKSGLLSGFSGAMGAVAGANGTGFDTKQFDQANTYTQALTALVTAVQQALNAFAGINSYSGVNMPRLGRLLSDIYQLAGNMLWQAKQFKPNDYASGLAWGGLVSNLAGAIKSGVDTLTGLASYTSPAPAKVAALENDLYQMVKTLVEQARKFSAQDAAGAAAWGTNVGTLFNGIKGGLDLLTSLKTYSSPARASVQSFENDTVGMVADLTTLAGKFDPATTATLAAWGDNVGRAFGGVKSSLDLFAGIAKFQPVGQGQAQLLFDQVDMVVRMAERTASLADMSGLDQAVEYATKVDAIYSKFNNVFAFYNNLDHLQSSPVDLIRGFLQAFQEVTGFNWQPQVSPAIQALSNGGTTPALSAGISMPVPGSGSSSTLVIEGPVTVQLTIPTNIPLTKAQSDQVAVQIKEALLSQGKGLK
ncbi:MAG: phage tail tape measure protein [Chloroflexi bacterium 54-19]|nr:MAG: phage tail tape measure protein [Chloroflexi bacterium 54-19]